MPPITFAGNRFLFALALASQRAPAKSPTARPTVKSLTRLRSKMKKRLGLTANAAVWSYATGMLLSLATGRHHPETATHGAATISVPMVASIGKIQIGCSTLEDAERVWGGAKPSSAAIPIAGAYGR